MDECEESNILEEAGYESRKFGRGLWVNRKAKKIFSQAFVEDHKATEVRAAMAAENEDGWEFYFNRGPEDRIKREILAELGESGEF